MRAWWAVVLITSCHRDKEQSVYVDEWTTRPREVFSNTLKEDTFNAATIDFTIKLPHGMFHDPTSEPERGHAYGVWKESGLLSPSVPNAFVRLAPYGAKTLDDLARDSTYGAQLVAKQTLQDGTLSVTTREGTHAWRVVQMHFDPAGRRIQCSASRRDDEHELGEPTRRMLEEICSSLVVVDRLPAGGTK
jgi:hypothetical protein